MSLAQHHCRSIGCARTHGEEIALTTDFNNKDRIVQLASQARSGQMDWVSGDVEWCGCVDCGLPVRTGRWQLWKSSVQGRAMNRPLGLNFWPIPIWMWDAAGAQSSLVSSGHMVANASLAAQTTKAGWLSGQFSGVEQYKQPGLASWMFRISRMSQKNL